MTKTLALILALTVAAPVHAGGPVIVEDKSDIVAPADRNDWIIPVIVGGLVICAIVCGSDGDAPAGLPPKVVCYAEVDC